MVGRDRRGLTLLEVLIAAAILSCAVIPLVLVVNTGGETVRGTRDVSGAVFVAQQTLERMRTYDFDDLDESDPRCEDPSKSAERQLNEEGVVEVGAVVFYRKVDVRPVSADRSLQARLATVKVHWEREGKTLAYEVSTVLSSVK